jgi:hypothetical protein
MLSMTVTNSTLGHALRASRSWGSICVGLPRRIVPSAVITAFAAASWTLEAMAPGAKPEKRGTSIAPMLATA